MRAPDPPGSGWRHSVARHLRRTCGSVPLRHGRLHRRITRAARRAQCAGTCAAWETDRFRATHGKFSRYGAAVPGDQSGNRDPDTIGTRPRGSATSLESRTRFTVRPQRFGDCAAEFGRHGPRAAGFGARRGEPVSQAFRFLLGAREKLYESGILDQLRLNHPVISIANLTLGGTGKTPLVIALAEGLRDRGFRPVILSRGYGRTSRGVLVVGSDWED